MSVSGEDAGGGGRFVSMAQPQNICCRNHRAQKPHNGDRTGEAAEREGTAVPAPWKAQLPRRKRPWPAQSRFHGDPEPSGQLPAASGLLTGMVRGASASASTGARGAEAGSATLALRAEGGGKGLSAAPRARAKRAVAEPGRWPRRPGDDVAVAAVRALAGATRLGCRFFAHAFSPNLTD